MLAPTNSARPSGDVVTRRRVLTHSTPIKKMEDPSDRAHAESRAQEGTEGCADDDRRCRQPVPPDGLDEVSDDEGVSAQAGQGDAGQHEGEDDTHHG